MSTKIPGLRMGTWLACFVGGFFVNRPWSQSPKYIYISYFTLYAILFNIASGLAGMDFIILAHSFLSNRSFSDQIFGLSVSISGAVFCWSYKILFFTEANAINRLWNDLALSDKHKNKDMSKIWLHYKILFTLQLAIAITHMALYPYYSSLVKEDSRIIVSVNPYNFILLFVFVTCPNIVLNQFSYWYVVTATFYLLFTVEDFCNGLKLQVQLRNLAALTSFQGLRITGEGNVRKVMSAVEYPEIQIPLEATSSGKLLRKEEILATFQRIKYLCNCFSVAVAPFYLLVIVSSVVVLVHSVATILLNGLPSNDTYGQLLFVFGCTHVLYEGSRLTAILVGGIFHRRVEEQKEELLDQIFLMETSTYKTEMENIVHLFSSWNWRITAWGVFIVDRHVLAGVMSAVLSYVVILFQIKLSDKQFGPSLNPTNATV